MRLSFAFIFCTYGLPLFFVGAPHLVFKGTHNLASSSFDPSAFLTRLGRIALRIGLGLIAAVAVISLLVVSLGLLLLGLLRALITGQRPKAVMKFNFQNFSARQGPIFWPGGQREAPTDSETAAQASAPPRSSTPLSRLGKQAGAVVDVEARDISERPPT